MLEDFNQITEIIEKRELYYIYDFKYELINSELQVTFCEDPDDINITLKLVFFNISELQNKRYHDPGDSCLAEVQNYDFEEIDSSVKVTINTGDSILTFLTSGKPEVTPLI